MEAAMEMEMFAQLFIALVLGSLIGLERSIAGKQAGMRTFALVTVGSCLLMLMSQAVLSRYPGVFDPLRVAAGVVTGIGFLGAGLIIFQQELKGLTTAASLWVSASIGMALGFKLYLLAAFTTFLTLFVFIALWFIENYIETRVSLPDRNTRTRIESLDEGDEEN